MREYVELRGAQMDACLLEIVKRTSGPGEGAAMCLALFVRLWSDFQHEPELDSIAEAARAMILSYQQETVQ